MGFPGDSQWRRHELYSWIRKVPWRRKWQPTPVFLPEKSQEHRSLAGCSPRGLKELDMTEHWSQREPQLARCARELPFKWMLQSHASLYTIGAQDDILTATSGEVLKQNSKPLLEAWHHEKVYHEHIRPFDVGCVVMDRHKDRNYEHKNKKIIKNWYECHICFWMPSEMLTENIYLTLFLGIYFRSSGLPILPRFSDFTLLKPSLELAPHSGRITDIPWGFTESFCLLEHASEVRLKSLCNCPR